MKSSLVKPLYHAADGDIRTILEKNSDQEFLSALEKYNTEQFATFKTSESDRQVHRMQTNCADSDYCERV